MTSNKRLRKTSYGRYERCITFMVRDAPDMVSLHARSPGSGTTLVAALHDDKTTLARAGYMGTCEGVPIVYEPSYQSPHPMAPGRCS